MSAVSAGVSFAQNPHCRRVDNMGRAFIIFALWTYIPFNSQVMTQWPLSNHLLDVPAIVATLGWLIVYLCNTLGANSTEDPWLDKRSEESPVPSMGKV
ncbi:MAG: hypothetical protein ACAI35_17050 [Candidatus Methylacidiphilales bacterium]|nr:hypothetical protein [Candidatus Methylacidiphilales bacterium]